MTTLGVRSHLGLVQRRRLPQVVGLGAGQRDHLGEVSGGDRHADLIEGDAGVDRHHEQLRRELAGLLLIDGDLRGLAAGKDQTGGLERLRLDDGASKHSRSGPVRRRDGDERCAVRSLEYVVVLAVVVLELAHADLVDRRVHGKRPGRERHRHGHGGTVGGGAGRVRQQIALADLRVAVVAEGEEPQSRDDDRKGEPAADQPARHEPTANTSSLDQAALSSAGSACDSGSSGSRTVPVSVPVVARVVCPWAGAWRTWPTATARPAH